MDPHGFDRLARLLARLPASPTAALTPQSRRQVLRGFAVGMVGTVAFARTPARVAAALCPQRIPRPGYRPTANGCGPSGYGWTVPDSWNRAHFTAACNTHDRCYGTCNKPRAACDRQIRQKMHAACDRAYSRRDGFENLWRLRCRKRANTYFRAIRRFGQSAYEAAQEEACICCPPERKCGTTCCSEGTECCGNQCRFSSVGPWDQCEVGDHCCGSGATCCGGANGLSACCNQNQICVLDCLDGAPGCCPTANPDCCIP